MEVIKHCTCETQLESRKRERYWYDELQADLNMNRPQVSREEERLKGNEYTKQYKIDNEDAIKARQKQFKIANKDKMKASKTEYKIANKDKIKEHQSQWIECDACNCEIRKG